MTHSSVWFDMDDTCIESAADGAARAIPPAWPLAATVAVNPFLGQRDEHFVAAAARLGRVAGTRVTMPRSWYRSQIASGRISPGDLRCALRDAPFAPAGLTLADLHAAASGETAGRRALPTVADLAADASGIDWPAIIAERIGLWAAGYFDEGQAPWQAPREATAYAAWRAFATHDLTPEVLGLEGFARHVFEAPDQADAAIRRSVARLGLEAAACHTYFHQLLMSLGGWAQLARYRLWQAELAGATDPTTTDLLAVRLLWEDALLRRFGDKIADGWRTVCRQHAAPLEPDRDAAIDAILQDAADRAVQREIADALAARHVEPLSAPGRPSMQAVFCIDVRSEPLRRALESLDPAIQTFGFAGFFGLPLQHRRHASDVDERHLPVLLNPTLNTRTRGADGSDAFAARVKARATRAWGRFKLAAVSSFAFVEAMGPVYAGKLLRDALRFGTGETQRQPAPALDSDVPSAALVESAERILRAMSLTQGFARLVLFVGHGAKVVNNPHASALQCGACGGHAGDVNARLLAELLNRSDVRDGLRERGISIPGDTRFVAGLHDTASDAVAIFDQDVDRTAHRPDLTRARAWFARTAELLSQDRAPKMPPRALPVGRRGADWSETRPELGLAGCAAFIAAPRDRTAGRNLDGRAFLHDYDWTKDDGYSVLELIMTAPVVVASWISLQYYGSTVAPETFGGGNKLLHNVVGGIGVVEGTGGLLRTGLPWQSLHDGTRYLHEPVRLSVFVEAPEAAVTGILARHPDLRALFDNGWMHLLLIGDDGSVCARYAGNLEWRHPSEEVESGRRAADLRQQDARVE